MGQVARNSYMKYKTTGNIFMKSCSSSGKTAERQGI